METTLPVIVTIAFALLGWALWAWIEYNLLKDEYDDRNEKFPWAEYKYKNKEKWIGSFILGIMVILVAHYGMQAEFVDLFNQAGDFSWKWSNMYYFGGGAMYEVILFLVKRIKRLAK